ncbi:HAD family hydrolase [Cellulomonas fimi]|uniref:Cof-like hydrolase n=1 Tax=Cellulomonas fimi (strain ATCC 484 / DSM 20113 / JCM 1341 / CCUG 24087 / LMG 16345 / NBRC 15513 / NCIMB 8980 / NCTC 7547 / NRS-133) TaxID=590998 RepID=F4H7E4_CELFA|nr:HAD family hydrolase [Cellulomonas fimi]AEE46905.1 Cof-like hydrolase [Cellulomonas fimi ATCC 484]NNH07852.1 HAD family phosphatase [Cellulomonas fimi]VEH34522.1 Phosphatase YidA [Cellulomonas fimi]
MTRPADDGAPQVAPTVPPGAGHADDLPRTPPRLVATDLDGTLLRPDGTVSARTAAALAAAEDAGLAVVFVTARPHRWLADLQPHVAGHGVALCANGASVVDVGTLQVLEQHGMPADVVADLAARIRARWGADHVHLAAEGADGFAHEHRFLSEHAVPAGSRAAARIEDVLSGPTLKLLVRTSGDPRDGAAFVDALVDVVGDLAVVADSGAHGLGEISGPGVTKAAGLARWAATQGVDAADVWAVGDAPNDLPMLAWAGTAFAVANAYPVVRDAADHVLPANADDGVAVLLEHAATTVRASRA